MKEAGALMSDFPCRTGETSQCIPLDFFKSAASDGASRLSACNCQPRFGLRNLEVRVQDLLTATTHMHIHGSPSTAIELLEVLYRIALATLCCTSDDH